MRSKQEWLTEFDEVIPLCKWFIVKYFGDTKYDELLRLRKDENTSDILKILNDVWFKLPDSFNILNGMDEWRKFIGLIEFYSEEEVKAIL